GVRGRELARGELVAVVSPGHPLAGAERVPLSRLADEPFVDFPAGSAGRIQSDDAFAAAGVRREVAFEVSTPEFMARLIREGLVIGMMPAAFTTALQDLPAFLLLYVPGLVEHIHYSHIMTIPDATDTNT